MKKYGYIVTFLICVGLIFGARVAQGKITRLNYPDAFVIKTTSVPTNQTLVPSDAIDVSNFAAGSLQVVWADQTSGGSTKTATFEVRSTTDGTNYDVVSDSSVTTSGVTGSRTLEFSTIPGLYLKVYMTGTNASAGTITPYFIGKKY